MAVLPIADLRKANVRFVELNGCREELDSLYSENRTFVGLVNNQKATIKDLKEAIKLDQQLINDKDKLAVLCDSELKKSQRRIHLLKIERVGLAGVCAILSVLVLLAHN